jgi:hypothetical protein
MWYGYTVAPGDPPFRAASHDSGIDGDQHLISTS